MLESAKILVLDEEEDTADLFQQSFRKHISKNAYSFSFVKSKKEAEELLACADFDVFIIDIAVLAFDVSGFIKQISTNYPFLETIIVSAYNDVNILRDVMRCGAHDFVAKPIDFQDFKNVVENALRFVKDRRTAENNAKKLDVITGEIGLSAQLQKSILPGNELKQGSVEIWADSVPTAEVGGDFYDFFWLSSSKLGMVIADVSGKNISAAMFAVISKTLIKTFAKLGLSPSECFKRVNRILCEENVATMFVTAMYGIFDLETNKFTYTNAGHLPLIEIKPLDGPAFIECESGIALGIAEEVEFIDNVLDITPGEMLLLYTDGVSEAINTEGEEFDFDRLINVIKNSRLITPKILTQKLFSSIKEFTNGAAQSDDITTLCFKYKPRIVSNVT
ncbi:MAG: response regulator [Alphaproteobacteria bacterium]|nr:response regulator [Alphaproteobacteria bacterium]